ncbi:MAG: beta-lactamase family protein [Chloroflexi bacterium]|nr:beta-lactamase family protein [Chloroflexota bacterium]
MRLVAAGQLELDTPIDEVLPDLQLSVPGAIAEVTLRKLLAHTAALPTAAEHYGSRDPGGLRESIYKDVARYPLIAPVGKIWSYSNPGINLAGYLAEHVSGKPYTQLMQELVFDPLEMKRTTLDPTVAMTYPIAQSHTLDAEGNLQVDHHYADNSMHYPSGFVMSTVLDLANFAIMHMCGGSFNGQQILTPELIAEMHTPHTKFSALYDDGYGLTFSSYTHKGMRVVGHGGRISSFASSFEFIPQTGTAVILLANNSALWGPHESRITQFVFDALLDLPGEQPPLPTIDPDRSLWARFVGHYVGGNAGAAEIALADDTLSLVWQGQTFAMQAMGADQYVVQTPDGTAMPVTFLLDGDGPAAYVSVVVQPGHAIVLERLVIDPAYRPDVQQWAPYVGVYENSLGKLTVRLDGDQMLVNTALFGGVDFPARPIDKVRFLLPFGLITFEPDGVLIGAAVRFMRIAAEPSI